LFSVTVTLLPGAALVVLTESVGGLMIVKVIGADTPPPGDGVATATVAVPTDAMSAAEMVARRSVELTNVVGRLAPFHVTTDVATKLLPVTANVNCGPPTDAKLGDKALITGTGFGGGDTVTGWLVAALV
jgi:hypothetical protein